jgi:hypothetical protein
LFQFVFGEREGAVPVDLVVDLIAHLLGEPTPRFGACTAMW